MTTTAKIWSVTVIALVIAGASTAFTGWWPMAPICFAGSLLLGFLADRSGLIDRASCFCLRRMY